MADWEDAGWEDAEGWEAAPSSFEAADLIPGSIPPSQVKAAWDKAHPPEGLGTKALGVGEAALNLGANVAAGITLPFALAAGNGVLEDTAKAHFEREVYQPRTQFGQDISGGIGEVMNQIGVPLAGHLGSYNFQRKPRARELPPEQVVVKNADGWEDAPAPKQTEPWLQRQLDLGEQMDTREQQFADMNNIQGELDLRPKQHMLDENGMPVDMQKSLDVQEARLPEQLNLLDEDQKAAIEMQRTNADMAQKAAEQDIAYGQKAQAEAMQNMVGRLQDKFQVPKKQRGAIDTTIFDPAYDKLKKISEDVVLRFRGGPEPTVYAIKLPEKEVISHAKFGRDQWMQPTDASHNLEAKWVETVPEHQRKGIAREMYSFVSELGNDIVKSDVQTDQGKGLWNSMEKQGASAGGRVIPKSQRGAIDFEGITEGLKKFGPQLQTDVPAIKNIVGKNWIPADPLPKDIVANALKEGKDTNSWNVTKYTASGSSLEAMTRKSELVQGVSRIVQNAEKRADLYIAKTVVPMERQIRSMSTKEVTEVADALKQEMLGKEVFTVEQLQAKGFNEAQLKAYANHRQLMDNTLYIQNQAREKAGLKPVDGKEYYTSSRWRGDFRQPVRDEKGRLVFYLAADSKLGLQKQLKALQEKVPGLTAKPSESHRVRTRGYNQKSDLQTMYSTMLDVLGRDDPAVAKLREAYEEIVAAESQTTLGQQKHFERKAGIRGFVGDRPGTKPGKEALEMFQEQVTYAKNAYKWSALQEAAGSLKEVLGNEELNAQQPKNVDYAKEYFKNALGHGEARWVAAMQDAFRDTGFSPNYVDMGVNTAKGLFITQKLAASLGYTMANLMQVMNTVPHLVDVMVKNGGNPLTALPVGMLSGITMGAGHYLNKAGGDLGKFTKDLPFFNDAFKYGEENGITSRSVYDESPINQRGPVSKGMEMLGKTMTVPETFIRSAAYMTFVKMLKDSGKFANDIDVFQKAEELTNASMVDYRASERPLGFAKAGIAGNALNTLQTYPINLYNQYRYFTKEAARGNVAPLASMIALQYAMAGAMGMPGFQDLDKLISWAKGHVPDSVYMKLRDFDPKLWMIENLGEASVYGLLSTESDIAMTSRLSAPGGMDMIQAPGGPIMDIAKQAGSVANAVTNPNETTFAQAARDTSLTGLQGMLETGPFREQNIAGDRREDGTQLYKKATDLADRQGQYARTPREEKLRSLGLRSQKEVFTNDMNYKVGAIEKNDMDRSKSVSAKYYDAIRRGDTKKAEDLQKLYTQINGHPIEDRQVEEQIIEEFTTTLERKGVGAKERLNAIQGLARLKKLVENRNANNN